VAPLALWLKVAHVENQNLQDLWWQRREPQAGGSYAQSQLQLQVNAARLVRELWGEHQYHPLHCGDCFS
jgi:hypothetical protein